MHDHHTSRLFFALLPDDRTVDAINWHADQYSPRTGRKVRPENFHITLLFLGNVNAATQERLIMTCNNLHSQTFDLEISTSGWWKKAGIFWLAPEHTPAKLTALHESLVSAAGSCRLTTQKRPYAPHITIMRKVTQAPQHPLIKPFTWQAEDFSLMQSITHSDGVEYRELATWPLSP